MQTASTYRLVLVTAPDLKTARRLTKAILSERTAACVNLIANLESHYWWRGKLERSREILLVIKTTRARMESLETVVLRVHPYDTPEIVALPLGAGTPRYLDWITASVSTSRRRAKGDNASPC